MTRWQEGGQSSDRGPITGHKLHETSFVMTLARATEQWGGRQAGMSQKTGRWRSSNVGCSAQARFRQHCPLTICIWFGWVWQILYQYQTTRSKYLFWYWGEVPCLARLNNGCWSQTQCWLWPDSSQLLDGRPGIGREGINKIYDLILDAEIYHAAAFVMTMMDGIASVEF